MFASALAQQPGHSLAEIACAHCHTDPHQAATEGTAQTAPCITCHTTDAWSPSTFTIADHAAIVFPLEGLHTTAPCTGCHVKAKLVGLPRTCAECHVDRHRGKLGEDCTECHTVAGFTPVDGFDHQARTGFALVGHHQGLPCTACHQGANGQAMRLTLEPGCTTCHVETHATFSEPCGDCHALDDATFAAAARGFDHRPTAFPLQRRHRSLGCAACHAVGQTEPPAPQCRACHDDPHSGAARRDLQRLPPPRSVLPGPVRPRSDRLAPAGSPLRHPVHLVPQPPSASSGCGTCAGTATRWNAVRGPASVPAHRIVAADCADCHGTWSWR